MKKLGILVALFLFLSPAFGFAAELRQAETIGKDESVKNLYTAGQNPTIGANVKGDLVVAGKEITVNGSVEGGVLAAGSTLNLNGAVGQSVRVAGGTVNINGTVGGDVVVFAGEANLAKDSVVSGDVIVFGGSLNLYGKVEGSVKTSFAGTASISGIVNGDVTLTRVGQLTLANTAIVGGTLKYASQNEATVSSEAKVGKTEYSKVATTETRNTSRFNLFALLSALVTLLLFIFFAPKFTAKVVSNTVVNPWSKFGIGLLALIVTPIIGFLLLVTFFGWGVMGYLFLAYVSIMALATTLSALFVGSLAWKLVRKEAEFVIDWRTAVIGVLIMAILRFVPVIGWLAALVAFSMVFGTLVIMGYDFFKAQRA